MTLPTNIDASYADTGDPSRKIHQQHHDTLHGAFNDPGTNWPAGNAAYVAPAGKTTTGAAAPLPLLNVLDYGAVAGAADNYAAFAAAVAAGAGLTPKTYAVWVPAGTWNLSATLNLPTGCVLAGPTGHLPSTVGAAVIQPTGDFPIVQNSDQTNGNKNITVEGLYFNSLTNNTSDILKFNSSGTRSTGIRIRNTYVAGDCKGNKGGIRFSNVGESEVVGCWVEVNGPNAIYLESSADNFITRNQCYTTGYAGSVGINVNNCGGNIVTNNMAFGAATFGIQLTNVGATENIIANNRCNTNGQAGISILGGAHHNTVHDNVCYDNGGAGPSAGIWCAGAGTAHNDIHDNVCKDNGSGNQHYGINVYNDPTNNQLHDNIVNGNTLAGILDQGGTTNSIRNNDGYNPQGPAAITVTASPFTYTAGQTPEVVYIDGGTVSAITKSGTTVRTATGASVPLSPGQAVVVTYTAAPTMTKDRL